MSNYDTPADRASEAISIYSRKLIQLRRLIKAGHVTYAKYVDAKYLCVYVREPGQKRAKVRLSFPAGDRFAEGILREAGLWD